MKRTRILVPSASFPALCALAALCLCGCKPDSMSEQRATPAALAAVPAFVAVGPVPGGVGKPTQMTNPYDQDPAAVQDGRSLFVTFNCSGCHGGRAGGGMGPSLRDQQWIYGSSDAQIFDSIASGRANGMPSWGSRLPEQEIWRLVSYIKSLRTGHEPDAPTH